MQLEFNQTTNWNELTWEVAKLIDKNNWIRHKLVVWCILRTYRHTSSCSCHFGSTSSNLDNEIKPHWARTSFGWKTLPLLLVWVRISIVLRGDSATDEIGQLWFRVPHTWRASWSDKTNTKEWLVKMFIYIANSYKSLAYLNPEPIGTCCQPC